MFILSSYDSGYVNLFYLPFTAQNCRITSSGNNGPKLTQKPRHPTCQNCQKRAQKSI
jgi:hypothetical protein